MRPLRLSMCCAMEDGTRPMPRLWRCAVFFCTWVCVWNLERVRTAYCGRQYTDFGFDVLSAGCPWFSPALCCRNSANPLTHDAYSAGAPSSTMGQPQSTLVPSSEHEASAHAVTAILGGSARCGSCGASQRSNLHGSSPPRPAASPLGAPQPKPSASVLASASASPEVCLIGNARLGPSHLRVIAHERDGCAWR